MLRKHLFPKSSMLALLITAAGAACAGASTEEVCTKETCGEYGTKVTFLSSPAAAAKLAEAEEKLVLVLHVSGHFEKSEYT